MRLRWILLVLISRSLLADWRDDAGYGLLQTELGPAMPTGAGISVMLSEASFAPPASVPYLFEGTAGTTPFIGTGSFAGKTITPHSGPSGVSGHAQSVAAYFFGIGYSVAPGVTDVHAWLADDFLGEMYFNDPQPVFAGSVQNHSWAGTTGDDAIDTEILRRLDFMVARDGVIVTTPLNNGASMAKLAANAYNTLCAGVRSGNHPHTNTNLDGLGRMKPDLVVEHPFTSFAGPSVASAATMLLQTIRASYVDADDPRVVKALLMGAASKKNLLGWQRAAANKPYDAIYGAGELNVINAYHMLVAGRQPASDITERSAKGWDKGTSTAATPQRYFFTIPAGRWANSFSAALTWHRQVSGDYLTSTLSDLNLRLVSASGLVPGATVNQSISVIDNVEHVFLRNLPAGQYALEVTANADGETFGLAWEAQLGSGPTLSLQRSGSTNTLSLAQLDPFKTYTLESSTTLTSWTAVTTIRTADTTPATTAQWAESSGLSGKFYQLRWTP